MKRKLFLTCWIWDANLKRSQQKSPVPKWILWSTRNSKLIWAIIRCQRSKEKELSYLSAKMRYLEQKTNTLKSLWEISTSLTRIFIVYAAYSNFNYLLRITESTIIHQVQDLMMNAYREHLFWTLLIKILANWISRNSWDKVFWSWKWTKLMALRILLYPIKYPFLKSKGKNFKFYRGSWYTKEKLISFLE